jgi:hypothetical protein
MGGLVAVSARTQAIYATNWISGIVTLATPFMGGPLLCDAAANGVCKHAEVALCGNWNVKCGAKTFGGVLVSNVALLLPVAGTWDLATYYDMPPFTGNPYLKNLWNGHSERFDNIYAIYGSSNELSFEPKGIYGWMSKTMTSGWGANDGIVPVSSAIAAKEFLSSTPQVHPPIEVGRDHSQEVQGCFDCTDSGSVSNYDANFNKMAAGLVSFLPPGSRPGVTITIAPPSATLTPGETQQFYATVTGTDNTDVTWDMTGGFGSTGDTVNLFNYTAPNDPGHYTVTAISQADPSKSATATVTVAGGQGQGYTMQAVGGTDRVVDTQGDRFTSGLAYAQITDSSGNPLADQSLTVTITGPSGWNNGNPYTESTYTADDGTIFIEFAPDPNVTPTSLPPNIVGFAPRQGSNSLKSSRVKPLIVPQAVPGMYTLSATVNGQQVSDNFTIDPSNAIAPCILEGARSYLATHPKDAWVAGKGEAVSPLKPGA